MPVINIVKDAGNVQVWLDTEGCVQDGTIVGIGPTRASALDDAQRTLRSLAAEVDELLEAGE